MLAEKPQSHRKEIIGFFALLFVVEWYLYFRNPGHFFQADTTYLLYHRATSILDFLREFVRLHPSGWYRPLANEPIESILYPILGLHPTGYRIPVYALFLADTAAVYALVFAVSRRRLTAAIATFFFSIHTTNAFTTYDLAYIPELLYTFFYIGSVLAYLRYVQDGTKAAYRISLACFVGSLLSKESAATLPFTLVALELIAGSKVVKTLRSTSIHFLVLVLYLVYAIGYLHVMGVAFETLLKHPTSVPTGSYQFVLDNTVTRNADIAATWAFNIPRGWMTQYRHLTPGMLTFLKVFRVIVLALAVFLMWFRRERRLILAGLAWFVITVAPGLPLLEHFLPYYLFLPVVGLSLVIGAAFTWTWDRLRSVHPAIAAAPVAVLLGGMLYVCSSSIRSDIRDHLWLGGSARLALSSLNDLKELHPTLKPDTTIYIQHNEEPGLWWDQATGGLIKMAYNTENITVLYSGMEDVMPVNLPPDKLIVLKLENRHLVDTTVR